MCVILAQNKKSSVWGSKWRRIRNDQSKLATDGGCDINWRRGNEVLLESETSETTSASDCLSVTSLISCSRSLHCSSHSACSCVCVYICLMHLFLLVCVCVCVHWIARRTLSYTEEWTLYVCVCVCSIHLSAWRIAPVSSRLPFTRHWLSPWDRDLFSQLAQSEMEGPAV